MAVLETRLPMQRSHDSLICSISKKTSWYWTVYFCHQKLHEIKKFLAAAYPEIGDANFKGALWTFKQQLVSKMRVRCRISIVLL